MARDTNRDNTTMEAEDFAAALAEFERDHGSGGKDPKVGEKVRGRVISITADAAFVDLGGKSVGVIDLAELTDESGEVTTAVGDEIEALVTARDEEAGYLVLRARPGRGAAVPSELRQAQEHGLPVEGMVTGVNKGGAEVEVAGVRAFCPVSQLDTRYVENPADYVGQRLQFRVTRYEEEGRGRGPNIVLSRRALLEEEAAAKAAETRARLKPGAVVKGTVTSLTKYGAFVDLGGLEGLLHVSEMSHRRIGHPKELLTAGQVVEVEVLKIEPGKDGGERISLSRRSLERDPWEDVASRYPRGTVLTGKVRRVESFGAFVELEPGLEGLVHISELGGEKRLQHAREAVSAGQDLEVKVLSVDVPRRRISLTSAASAQELPEAAEVERYTRSQASGSGFGALGDFFERAKGGE